jgi:hypothetical protein
MCNIFIDRERGREREREREREFLSGSLATSSVERERESLLRVYLNI